MCTNGVTDSSGKTLSDEDVNNCVNDLRKLVSENDKLKRCRTEDRYLLRFLHSSNFDVPVAFKKMEVFRDLILDHPDWFATNSPLDMKKQIEVGDKAVIREKDKDGRWIMVVKLGKMDVVNSSPEEQSRIFDMWLELFMDDPEAQRKGLSAIVDFDGFSWRLFRWFTPGNIRVVVRKVDSYPFKELLMHVVKTNFLLSATIKLIWPFLNDRVKNMFKFHFDNWPSLHEYIHPDILPAEYGGNGPDFNVEKCNEALFDQDSVIGARLKYQEVPKEAKK